MIISLYPYLLRIIAKCVDMVLVLLFFFYHFAYLCIFILHSLLESKELEEK